MLVVRAEPGVKSDLRRPRSSVRRAPMARDGSGQASVFHALKSAIAARTESCAYRLMANFKKTADVLCLF